MKTGWPLIALIAFGLFGYLSVSDKSIVLSFLVAVLAAIVATPTLLALFDHPKQLLKNRFTEVWLGTLLTVFLCYAVAVSFLSTVPISVYTVLALAMWLGFVFMAGNFLPFSVLFSIVLLSVIWIPFDNRVTTELFPWPPKMVDYPISAFLVTSICFLLFIKVRPLKSLSLDLPWRIQKKDFLAAFLGFAILAALLIPIAMATEFISYKGLPPLHKPFVLFVAIFFTIALPEELIFRGILQSQLATKVGRVAAVLIAAVLFGMTHWNNGDISFDWRYLCLASLAGVGYGLAYQVSGRLVVPVIMHTLVDTTWVSFFK